jgi:hypothetical protein
MTVENTDTLAGELLMGADAISAFCGHDPRQSYYLLEQGHTPARKVGSIWVASKRVLTDFCRTPTNIPAPPTASAAEPPPPTPRARAVRARRR